MINVSVVMVVKDNPEHTLETIKSVQDLATEIIIGDLQIESTLKKQLQNNPKIKIIENILDVPYADLIKEDLKKEATGDYILYLDPDEIFPQEAIKILEEKVTEYDYFYFPRKNIIFNKWIQYSRWWPDYQLRFFKRNHVVWPKTIHPIPHTTGKGYELEAKEELAILHYNYDSIDQYVEKARRYAKSEAQELIKERKTITLTETIHKGIGEFISRFFAAEGYKDGMHGFSLAFLQLFYYFLLYFYFWEKQKYKEHDKKELIEASRKFFHQGLFETSYWISQLKNYSENKKIGSKVVNTVLKLMK